MGQCVGVVNSQSQEAFAPWHELGFQGQSPSLAPELSYQFQELWSSLVPGLLMPVTPLSCSCLPGPGLRSPLQTSAHTIFTKLNEVSTVMTPILLMRLWGLTEVKKVDWGHRAIEWQGQDLKPAQTLGALQHTCWKKG